MKTVRKDEVRIGKWLGIGIVLLTWVACQEKDLYAGPEEDGKVSYNDFSFSTVAQNISLDVNYTNGGVPAVVYFELYGELPVREEGNRLVKREDVMPFYAAYTDAKGVLKDKIDLPAWIKKIYAYSPDFHARTLIKTEVNGGQIVVTDEMNSRSMSRAVTPTEEAYDSYMIMEDSPMEYQDSRWKTWLGEYDKKANGEVKYAYDANGPLAVDNYSELYSAHNQVIYSKQKCPEEYRSYADLYIQEDAEMAVTFLGQNSCWNSSLGYYYYKEGEKPASLNEANVIMLFPNTQDGQWENNVENSRKTKGIDRGTTVQLMYYPNIALGSKEGETAIFPAGYRIGFVLATNAWENRVSGFPANKKYRAATSEGLSVNNDGVSYNEPRTAVYRYKDQIMISFEDHTDDSNFSDVVITLKSNPVEAITDVPVVNPDNGRTTVSILKGIYAFEDLWPAKGDYDLNDVLVRYTYEKEFDRNNKIYSESFTFKTFQNYAAKTSGLAVKIDPSGRNPEMEYAIKGAGEDSFTGTAFTYERTDKVHLLTDHINAGIGTEYRVRLVYAENTPATKETSTVQPFIYRDTENGKCWEVHIPKEAPTSSVDPSFFRTADDASNPDQGIYYVRDGLYPFAFFLAGANENDLNPLLDPANERVEIGNLYPYYKDWVTSGGSEHPDWYKK